MLNPAAQVHEVIREPYLVVCAFHFHGGAFVRRRPRVVDGFVQVELPHAEPGFVVDIVISDRPWLVGRNLLGALDTPFRRLAQERQRCGEQANQRNDCKERSDGQALRFYRRRGDTYGPR
jgi:hypothetical protein